MTRGMSPPPSTVRRWRYFLTAVLLLGLSGAVAAAEVIRRVVGPALELGIDRAQGSLVAWVDPVTGRNLVGGDPATGGFWEVELEGDSGRRVLAPTQAARVDVADLGAGRSGLRLSWSGWDLPQAPDLRVVVTVEWVPGQALSRWRLSLEGLGGWTPERVRFPLLRQLPQWEDERLAMPFWAGLLAAEPRRVLGRGAGGAGRRDVDYPGHGSMQCLALYAEGGPGWYVASDDAAGHRKILGAFTEGREDLNLEVTHLPERPATRATRYDLPYAMVLGTFRGTWYDAAAIYRGWATNQVWAQQSRWTGGRVPEWVGDTGLWMWNRGRSPGVIEPALALQRAAGVPVSVFWHWWHGCPYDTGFPEYLPPREGEAPFIAAVRRAREEGVRAMVYMNQRLWGMTTASWTNEQAAIYAVKAADGTVRPEVYNTFSRLPCATMCLATDFWRRKYAGIAEEVFQRLGVEAIYMDQACSSLACYDPGHGHPRGGGTYWMAGFQALASDIRHRCADRDGVTLAGEGCAENWLPHLDLMLALDVSRERYAGPDGWDPIPFFHAVYHGFGVFYGSYASLTYPPYDDLWPAATAPARPLELLDRKFQRQFLLEHARAFCWGQQPTLANFVPSHLQDRPEELDFVFRQARLRRLARRYLQDGALLPPPVIEVAQEEIPMSRLSIYAGQQGSLREFRKTVPLALASAWRATDGGVALAVASLADRPLTPVLTVDADRCGLGLRGPVRVRAIGSDGTVVPAERRGSTVVLRPRLGPREVGVWEVQVGDAPPETAL